MYNKKSHRWSNEEVEYLKKIAYGKHYKEIAILMFEKFGYRYTEQSIGAKCKRLKIDNGFDGKFQKKENGVKKLPIGEERVTKNGYIKVKIAEPNVWEYKHRVEYEKYKGKIPKGYTVIFADMNKRNFSIENLLLVSNKQLLIINKNRLIKDNAELTKVGVNIAKVIEKVNKLKKEVENG